MIALREYQREAVAAVYSAWSRGVRRPAIVLPTGAGKTVVISDIVRALVEIGERSLVMAHREEIIGQTVNKLRSVLDQRYRVGVVKGERDEVGADVVVATVQTLRHQARRDRLRNVGLVVVDECHHATADSYRRVLDHYGNARALGVTATMSRADGDALGAIWEGVVYRRSVADLIELGFLVRPVGYTVTVEDLDLTQVRRSRGDYQDGALGEALSDSMAPGKIIEAWHEHAAGTQTILFAPTVAFAELMAETFRGAGIKADVVHGKQSFGQRGAVLEAFTRGDLTVICNCMVLTEGTDLPIAQTAVIARPTTHHGLYVQMVGRVLRPYPGKANAIVLDVAGAAKRHSLNAHVDLDGTAPRELTEKLDGDELEPEERLDEDTATEAIDFAGEFGAIYRDGRLVTEHVDLFHQSGAAWNRTYRGTWFLEVGTRERGRYIVLVQRGAEWSVAEVTRRAGQNTNRGPTGSAWIACGIPDLGYAMAIAEADVGWQEHELADKSRGWRNKGVSERQREQLTRFGLILPAGGRAAEASALIGRHIASERIDHPTRT